MQQKFTSLEYQIFLNFLENGNKPSEVGGVKQKKEKNIKLNKLYFTLLRHE